VVVGADGAATLADASGRPLVREPITKLNAIEDAVILGVSGSVGAAQLYQDSIRTGTGKLKTGSLAHIQRKLTNLLAPDADISKGTGSALVVLLAQRKAELLQYAPKFGSVEAATDEIPFMSLGSGQYAADPFLAFLRRVFWLDRLPKLNEGIFATVWTLEHAIRTSPGGIGLPMQVMTLKATNNAPDIESLSEEALPIHRQAIVEAEKHLRDFNFDGEIPKGLER
jgi:hypothetical protein